MEKNGVVQIIMKFKIVWTKKTMLQGTIEKKVVSETVDSTNDVVFPAMAEILKFRLNSKEYKEKYGKQLENKSGEGGQGECNENGNNNMNNEEKEEINKNLDEIKKELNEINQKNKFLLNNILAIYVMFAAYCLSQFVYWLIYR